MRRIAAALVVAVTAGLTAHTGVAATCVYPASYPGDNAPKATLAAWMAGGAKEAGLPVELPVMAALVESNMTNLNYGDADTAGYFQMPRRIWDSGDYAGFPDHPTIQLQWFIDQAQAVRQKRIAAGDTTYGQDPARYGEWVADVERPAEQYRAGAHCPVCERALPRARVTRVRGSEAPCRACVSGARQPAPGRAAHPPDCAHEASAPARRAHGLPARGRPRDRRQRRRLSALRLTHRASRHSTCV